MEKKYQIFISSTYTDLIDVRREIAKAVLRQTEIPAAMEDFGSIDKKALDYIKEVIDQCDYYVLIIAGRYGSSDETGISYTEQEYDYAVLKSKTVLVFIRKNVGDIPSSDVDTEKSKLRKLNKFREKASKGRLVAFWDDPKLLVVDVMIALSNAFRSHPGVGWVRAGNIDQSTAVKLKQLEYENHILKSEILELKSQLAVEDLALDDHLFLFEIVLEYFGRRGS